MNDDSEISFDGTTMSIHRGNKISIHHAAAVSDEKFNKITAQPLPKNCKKKDSKEKKKGIFHLFSKEVRDTIITVAIECAPVARAKNRDDIEKVDRENIYREEFMVKKNLDKSKK